MFLERNRLFAILALTFSFAFATGCSVYRNTVPGYCVGQGIGESRSDKEPINFLRLRQEPPDAYRLDERDVLGIYIEGVLGSKDEPPPVHFPEAGVDMPPAVGYPVPVREDGTLSLPLIEALDVRGLTLSEAEQRIRYTYINEKILKADRERIIVTLMRPRTYHVLVVREGHDVRLGCQQRELCQPAIVRLGSSVWPNETRPELSNRVEGVRE